MRGPANAPVRAALFLAGGAKAQVTLRVEPLVKYAFYGYTRVKPFCLKVTPMRAVIVVFILTVAVVWDVGQNNGHWIRIVTSEVSRTMQVIGIL